MKSSNVAMLSQEDEACDVVLCHASAEARPCVVDVVRRIGTSAAAWSSTSVHGFEVGSSTLLGDHRRRKAF